MRNFAFPYFSRDIAEFWRRWHISLSTWFRDYVYIPFGGSRGGKWLSTRNIFIIFIVSGFWHGANWTFIIWGALNAIYFLPIMLLGRNRQHINTVAESSMLPSPKEIIQICTTFFFTVIGWVFFRSETVGDAFSYLSGLFSYSLFTYPDVLPQNIIFLVALFVLFEWIQRKKQHALMIEKFNLPLLFRWGIYYSIIFSVLQFGGKQQEFIYFQF
jgi:D-alanyl-lipoteichoic acid acyltransferase DltB (MBOAT superfamily)